MQYCKDKDIPLINMICIASDGATVMTRRVKGFVFRIKSVAPHTSHVHFIVHTQHLAAKKIGDVEKAPNAAIHAINFVKANSLNDRLFMQFCETKNFKTLLLHMEVRWLSKGLRLKRFVNLWEQVINLLKFKSQMADCNNIKQAGKAKEILEKLETAIIKSKIFYHSDIFKQVNLLNLELQGKESDLVTCVQTTKGYVRKLKYWKNSLKKRTCWHLKISRKLILYQNALLHALFILKVFIQSLREDSRIF